MSSTNTDVIAVEFRRINEALAEANARSSEPLFGEFWREGELALMFGEPGVGKSLLAVQVAEAISRGRPLAPLQMPTHERDVLYIDLVLSDTQFRARYSSENGVYNFSENLYRALPPLGADVIEWTREALTDERFGVIVIDDLTALSRTNDGTRETLGIMRDLRRVSQERGASVLALADAFRTTMHKDTDERDLRRSRVLCGRADSVFGIGTVEDSPAERVIFQTRSQAAELVWTSAQPVMCWIDDPDDGLLGFEFEIPESEVNEQELICDIKNWHDKGQSFRELGRELGISKSTVARLYTAWTPELVAEVKAEKKKRPRNR